MVSVNFICFSSVFVIIFGVVFGAATDVSFGAVPAAAECTSFDLTTSGSSSVWRWSRQYPSLYIPSNSGHFLWSDVERSEWESDVYYNVSSTTIFTFQYFIMFPEDEISVDVKIYPSGHSYSTTSTTFIDATWRSLTFVCTFCCQEETFCDIQLVFIPWGRYIDQIAIDNLGRDNACVESQCYQFNSDSGTEWQSSTWKNSVEELPNLSQYPSFTSTKIDPYYTYIQDHSGSTKSPSTFYIQNNKTEIILTYFFGAPFDDSINSLSLKFYNILDLNFANEHLIIETLSSTWQKTQFKCGYCCGGADKLPCSIQIEIVADVNKTNSQALFAVDSIGTTCGSNPSTIPPPTPFCCSFDTSECGSIGAGTWSWSAQSPATNVSNSSGSYEWTNSPYAIWETDFQTGISDQTLFTFQYYIESPTSQIRISFAEYAEPYVRDVGTVSFSNREWHSVGFYCASCCKRTSPCFGQLFISAYIFDGSQIAIDNIGRDNVCYGLFSCCLFDDSAICNFVYNAKSGHQWQYSGNLIPTYRVPSPGSEYVYFETIIYTDPSPISVGLRSDFITIDADTTFRGNVFIYNPNSATVNNVLNVNFFDIATGQRTQLSASVASTDFEWQILYFYCDSIYGNCCQEAAACTGYIDFEAVVDADGGQVVYAIDAFEIEGNCNAFTG